MLAGTHLSLRFLLPLLLFILLLAQSLYIGWHTGNELKRNLQTNARSDLQLLMNRMQGTLEYLARSQQYEQIHAELTRLGNDYSLQLGVIVSENNFILASTNLDDLTAPLAKIIPPGAELDKLEARLRKVRMTLSGQLWEDEAGHLTGAYPIQLDIDMRLNEPERIGVLIITRDLSHSYRLLSNQLFESMLPITAVLALFVVGLGVVLHWTVTRRVRGLVVAAQRGARGEYEQIIDTSGNDELAQLAHALQHMFEQIARTQAELRRSEQLYSQAQQAADIGSWEWDIASGKITCSEPLEPMFGYAKGTFPGTLQALMDRTHPDDREHVRAAAQAALAGRCDYHVERRIVLPDGNCRWIASIGDVVRDKQGKPLRMFGIAQDVTARKQAEQALRESEGELRRHRDHLEEMVMARTAEMETVITELESFSYSVSHDLRAPLRAIAGFSEVIQEDYADKLDEQGRHYLERIRLGADRMGQLIDDLLNLSRVTRTDLHRERVEIGALFKDLIKELKRGTLGARVEFICQCTGAADVDPRLTRIMLTNLLSNAVKFSSKQPKPRVECGEISINGEQVFYVRDNGVGFNPQYADKLFTPFQRLHNPNDFEGTGIGLATAHRVVRRHGGRIWAESRQQRGAVFYFSFGKESAGLSPHKRVQA